MEHLTKSDLASVALVCRSWLPQARRQLYREINFDLESSNVLALNDTLRSNVDLLNLIRRLHLNCWTNKTDSNILDWIALLPEHSLQLIKARTLNLWFQDPLRIVLFERSPAVRTVRHLSLLHTSILTKESLSAVISYQYLETLSIALSDASPLPIHQIPERCMPRLKRLSLSLYRYGPAVTQLLEHVAFPLERFEMRAPFVKSDDVSALCRAIQRHLASLTGALFVFNLPAPLPFIDGLLPWMSRIETLACGDKAYTDNIFDSVPPTLRSISLCSSQRGPFPGAEYAKLVERGATLNVTSITVVDSASYPQAEACLPLAQACEEQQIAFNIIDMEDIYYQV